MTKEEAQNLKSGAKLKDIYFNRRGEVTGVSDNSFTVQYENGDSDEIIGFDNEDDIVDFEVL